MTSELRALIDELSKGNGFALCGVAAVPAEDSPEDAAGRAGFAEWIAQGRAGEMGYLSRADEQGRLLRSSLRVALPWAETVIVCALDYGGDAPLSIEPAPQGAGWIARYAWSGDGGEPTDYHEVMLRKLRRIERELHLRCGEGGIETRCYVDTGPIVERNYARYAGIGWVGKNTCVIHERHGSWLLLGVIATSLRLPQELSVAAAADRCGGCTRCIDACPTRALTAPREMDAGRCIAYLTIEKKGGIAEELRPLMGRQVFGCDICQEVCPWNGRAARNPVAVAAPVAEMRPRAELINPALEWLAGMDAAEFKRRFRGSPLERTGLKRLRRNVAIAMGNSGDAKHLERLRGWMRSEDEALRESAAWAARRLERVQK